MSWVLLGWGGVGVLTFCLVRTVNVATLPRSLECLLHCYAAEISGMLSTLLVATLPRSLECSLRYMLLCCRDLWNACYVTCCYAAEISGMLATLLRCRDLWNACYAAEISCYMPKCGNGASSISTRSCFRRLQTCCKSSSEKRMPHFVRSKWRRNLCLCFTVTKTTFPQKTPKFGRPNLSLFQWHK